jgi:uncharacterized protein YbjT (DUF2867 family)
MKIVVIGGSGRIGTKVVTILTRQGHEALAASPRTGVDATTGGSLAEALARAEVVVDVSNAPSFEDAAARAFFEDSGRHLAQAEREASVRHHVALSVVGTDRRPDNGYFRAKLAQERLIKTSGIPYTIIRATQFFEFLGAIAAAGADGTRVRLSNASFQPIAADDVAKAVADAALGSPVNETIDIAGPERLPLSALVARLDERSLVPGGHAHRGTIRLEEWLRQPRAR